MLSPKALSIQTPIKTKLDHTLMVQPMALDASITITSRVSCSRFYPLMQGNINKISAMTGTKTSNIIFGHKRTNKDALY